ncbi:PREDICTED: ankyrin repeat domain-containing protein 63 [Galeopterus variegatus]|uniref:Ankyrin repeat domain-containing protein 63 n=1 Tax=Galeopterus variegatus TaxID=482537 RepID=A0ABM0QUB0_GALVR|nr:PREDICTED: ankyrin repeat domain-containing protein 63 [Galeopterus variegatus]
MLKPKDLCPRAGTRTFLEAMQAGKVHLARFVLDALDRSIIDCRAEQGRTPLMVAVGLPDPHGGEAGSAGKSSGRHRAQGSERPELGRSMSLALGAVTEEEAARLRAGALIARPNSPQSSGTGRWRSHEVLEGAPTTLVQAPIGLSPHPEGGPGSGRLGLRRRSTAPDIPSLVGEAPGPESGPELEANALPLSVPGPEPWQAGTEAVVLHAQR